MRRRAHASIEPAAGVGKSLSMQNPCPLPQGGQWRRTLCAGLLAIVGISPAWALRIVVTNDDGFESRNLQALFTALKAAGHEVILSAPVRDQSGTAAQVGSLSDLRVLATASPGGRIPAGAPGAGPTTIAADQYYVNGTPATAVLYGIDIQAQAKWGRAPDLVIAGPNIGNNLGYIIPQSGTVGAAITALNRGIPAIAVAGANGDANTAPLLAEITLRVLSAVEENGKIALPHAIGLNVNAPVLDSKRTAGSYRYAFTQITLDGGTGVGVPELNEPDTENNAFGDGNTVTVSPIQGTYQAAPDKSAQVLTQMRRLFSPVTAVANPKLINIAIRGYVGAGDAVQIAGFYVTGNVSKTFLIRASGPALSQLGVSGVLGDPIVELFDKESLLSARNDNWSDDAAKAAAISAAAARVGAFPWTVGGKDAALLVTLPAGSYSVVVRGGSNSTGIALLEVYDAHLD
jgi:5'/3'-nucleotidase SurE